MYYVIEFILKANSSETRHLSPGTRDLYLLEPSDDSNKYIEVSLNDNAFVPANAIFPYHSETDIHTVKFKNKTNKDITVKLLCGRFRRDLSELSVNANVIYPSDEGSVAVSVVKERVGLARESTLSAIDTKLNVRLIYSGVNISVSANTNILTTNLTPTRSPSLFRIYVSISGFVTEPVFQVVRRIGTVEIVENLNESNTLKNNCAYMFDILVVSGEEINFRVNQNGTIARLIILEYHSAPG